MSLSLDPTQGEFSGSCSPREQGRVDCKIQVQTWKWVFPTGKGSCLGLPGSRWPTFQENKLRRSPATRDNSGSSDESLSYRSEQHAEHKSVRYKERGGNKGQFTALESNRKTKTRTGTPAGPEAAVAASRWSVSKLNVGSLFKSRCWLSRCGAGPEILHFQQAPGGCWPMTQAAISQFLNPPLSLPVVIYVASDYF